jgi:RHS repeat-associated protein
VAGPTPASFGYDAAGNLISSSTVGSLEHDTRLRLVRATVGNTVTDYKLNALGQRVAKSGATDKYFHYDGDGRLIAESDAAVRVQKEYVWLGDTPIAMIESAPPPAGPTCPATPELRRPGGFTPYERRERMEVHSGRPGERGWEWALGTNTRDFQASAREDVNWVSGKPYAFRLEYDGAGNANVRVSDAGTELFTLAWTGDMDVGNALRFVVRSPAGIGAGNLIRVAITNVDGTPVAETLATAGDDAFSREVRIFSGESLKDGYTVEGTVTFIFTGGYPPRGNRLDFHVTAGNVECESAGGGGGNGGGDAQARVYYIHPDHLDTPRALTDAQHRVVWRWDSDPFGAYPADEDPDGDGAKVTLNLRFPGQYFDQETGLHYNYFRDYDPTTGRYILSDPIGLEGGISTYAYVTGNPLAYSDRSGQAIDTFVDAGLIGYDLYRLLVDNVLRNCNNLNENLASLGLNAVGLLLPGVTGLGPASRAANATKRVGAYKDVGGHHVHAKQAFKGRPGYDLRDAYSVSAEMLEQYGVRHADVTAAQQRLFRSLDASGSPNNLTQHSRIAYKALTEAGMPPKVAAELVAESQSQLIRNGVFEPARIPWGRR